ncbi:uncharacterized protein [Henckelia pumila]|uniref:uncharacterized protein n=1 Tax=Henckelia pumila TaxID=405737 RepID=UPI003C6E6C5C
MEAFCLLAKQLRGGCAEGGDSANTIITAAVSPYSSDGEDGPPYFDLEFTTQLPQVHDQDKSRKPEINGSCYVEDDSDHEKEAKLMNYSTVTTSDDELSLFNGEFVPIDSSTHVLQHNIDSDHNSCKFPVSVLKSAAKFGVVLLKLKKSKPEERTENMPIKTQGNHGENGVEDQDRKSKQQHYLKMVKPLYVRISKAKLKLNMPAGAEKVKDGTLKVVEAAVKTSPMQWMQMGLLSGKSRSAPEVVAAAPENKMACNRRDDSLLQVQDGIQGAILHCKRSFINASIDTEMTKNATKIRVQQ